jgi:hypothetical protein
MIGAPVQNEAQNRLRKQDECHDPLPENPAIRHKKEDAEWEPRLAAAMIRNLQ